MLYSLSQKEAQKPEAFVPVPACLTGQEWEKLTAQFTAVRVLQLFPMVCGEEQVPARLQQQLFVLQYQ